MAISGRRRTRDYEAPVWRSSFKIETITLPAPSRPRLVAELLQGACDRKLVATAEGVARWAEAVILPLVIPHPRPAFRPLERVGRGAHRAPPMSEPHPGFARRPAPDRPLLSEPM